jgi:hypothetical protein
VIDDSDTPPPRFRVLAHLLWRSLPAVSLEVTGLSAPPAYRSFISAALGWCMWPPRKYSSHLPQPRCWQGCRFRRFELQGSWSAHSCHKDPAAGRVEWEAQTNPPTVKQFLSPKIQKHEKYNPGTNIVLREHSIAYSRQIFISNLYCRNSMHGGCAL